MRFDSGTRTRILVDLVLDIDPTGSTVEVRVGATWYPATWLGAAVTSTSGGLTYYTQTARTNGYFAGPDATLGSAVLLALGQHALEARVTSGTDILTYDIGGGVTVA